MQYLTHSSDFKRLNTAYLYTCCQLSQLLIHLTAKSSFFDLETFQLLFSWHRTWLLLLSVHAERTCKLSKALC